MSIIQPCTVQYEGTHHHILIWILRSVSQHICHNPLRWSEFLTNIEGIFYIRVTPLSTFPNLCCPWLTSYRRLRSLPYYLNKGCHSSTEHKGYYLLLDIDPWMPRSNIRLSPGTTLNLTLIKPASTKGGNSRVATYYNNIQSTHLTIHNID